MTNLVMHRLVWLAVIVATAPAAADPPAHTVGVSLYHQPFPVVGMHLAGAARVFRWQYVDAQLGVGGALEDGYASIRKQNVWSAQVGTSAIHWWKYAAVGARASVGYQEMEIEYFEALIDDEPFTENYDAFYFEGAVFGRLRVNPNLALELLIGRRHHWVVRDSSFGRSITSVGVHATF